MKRNNIDPKDFHEAAKSLIKARRAMFQHDFPRFRTYYFPHYHKSEDGIFQADTTSLLAGLTLHRGTKLAIAAPREHGKSTLVSLEYILHAICYKHEEFVLLISHTAKQSENNLENIKIELMTNPRLIMDFPEVCETGKKPGPPRWTKTEVVTRNNVKILALSTGQQIRGRRKSQYRPSLIVLDDLERDDSARNPEGYDKLEQWLTRSVLKAGSSDTNVVFIGTIHHYHSLLAKAISDDHFPGWTKRIYKAISSWSIHPELWEKWTRIFNNHELQGNRSGPAAALEFFEKNSEAMLDGTHVLWPAAKGYYRLMVTREEDGYPSFDSEFQNEPINPKDNIFNVSELHHWDERAQTEEELFNVLGQNVEFYGACDPSMGKEGRYSDFSAIITLAREPVRGDLYIIDADIARRRPDELIKMILAYAERRKYCRFGFEINAVQEVIKDLLEKESNASGIYLPIEGIRNSTDKRARIESIQPLVRSGAIRFSKRHTQLLEQMRCYPKGAHDDGLDALEMAVSVVRMGGGRLDISVTDRKEVLRRYHADKFEGFEEYFDGDVQPSPKAKEIKVL
jgi:predicted phage terminase large subunit-like protein